MFDDNQYLLVKNISNTLKANGYSCYVVGGAVRDKIMNLTPKDYDIATNALPEQIESIFQKTIPTGKEFGTITVVVDNINFELTTFREDGQHSDGRHPDTIKYSKDINTDLQRRDFTINAMAYDVQNNLLIDPFNGQSDIKNKIIRCVGNPETRFTEDVLRMLRACRFASRLNFKIEENTFSAIKILAHTITRTSWERIGEEIYSENKNSGIITSEIPSVGFIAMYNSGLMNYILPELSKCYGISQPEKYHKFDVFFHIMDTVDRITIKKPLLRVVALLHDIGKPIVVNFEENKDGHFLKHDEVSAQMAVEILKRFKNFSNNSINYVEHMIKNHMTLVGASDWRDNSIRRWINKINAEYVDDMIIFRIADAGASRNAEDLEMITFRERIKNMKSPVITKSNLAINGNDVMTTLQIPPSKRVGEILNILEMQVLDNPTLNTKEKLIALLNNLRN